MAVVGCCFLACAVVMGGFVLDGFVLDSLVSAEWLFVVLPNWIEHFGL